MGIYYINIYDARNGRKITKAIHVAWPFDAGSISTRRLNVAGGILTVPIQTRCAPQKAKFFHRINTTYRLDVHTWSQLTEMFAGTTETGFE